MISTKSHPSLRRAPENATRCAEIGVFLSELLHNVTVSAGIVLALFIAGQLVAWLGEHEEVITVAEHATIEAVERI
jgi:hypothetical protein